MLTFELSANAVAVLRDRMQKTTPRIEIVPVVIEKGVASTHHWNGRPIFAQHPTRDGQPIFANSPHVLPNAIGTLFNARVDGNKLLIDAHIDVEKAKRVAPPTTACRRRRTASTY